MICFALGGILFELLNILFHYILRVVCFFFESGRLQDFQKPLDIILILSRHSLG